MGQDVDVVVGTDPDEYAGCGALSLFRRIPSILESFPSDLQQQPVLRIHSGRLSGGNTKEVGVKTVEIAEKTATPRDNFAGRVGIGIIQSVQIPAPVGKVFNRIPSFREHPPKRFQGIATAGVSASHANDCNWFRSSVARLL